MGNTRASQCTTLYVNVVSFPNPQQDPSKKGGGSGGYTCMYCTEGLGTRLVLIHVSPGTGIITSSILYYV